MAGNIIDLVQEGSIDEARLVCSEKDAYRELFGRLFDLSTSTRPDITISVNILICFMEKPLQVHRVGTMRLLRYSVSTIKHVILVKM